MINTLLQWSPAGLSYCIAGCLSLLFFNNMHGQSTQKYFTAEKTFAVKLGTTKPLHESAHIMPTDPDKVKDWKNNKSKFVPNFGGRRELLTHNPNALPQGYDPLFSGMESRTVTTEILPLVNVDGINSNQRAR